MSEYSDKKLTCRDCGQQFTFTAGEQEFYRVKGFNQPGLCKECRLLKPNQRPFHTCSYCGNTLERGEPICCQTCITDREIEFEKKLKQKRDAASAAQTRLLVAEQRKAELEQALYQAEQLVKELELKISNMSRDLEKAYEFQSNISWLQPKFQNLEKKLKAMELTQREGSQKVAASIQTIKESHEHLSLWKMIKHSFRTNGRNGHNNSK